MQQNAASLNSQQTQICLYVLHLFAKKLTAQEGGNIKCLMCPKYLKKRKQIVHLIKTK